MDSHQRQTLSVQINWGGGGPEKNGNSRVHLCGPGCLHTNVGAGVFLFVIRGRSLIHELSSAETVIQYMLTGGVESEGGSLNHSSLYSPKFNLILKQKTALILVIPDIVKIFPENAFMVPQE